MTQSNDSTYMIDLASDLISQDAAELQQALLAALETGRPLMLRAQGVSRVGTVGLQLLLALQRGARARSLSVAIEGPSQALRDAARCLGLQVELGLDGLD